MKSLIRFIYIAIVFIVLTSFNFFRILPKLINGNIDKVLNKDKSVYEYVNEVGNEIIRCLNERDKIGLNNLFCDKIKDSDYLKQEIDIIFDYIDRNGGINIEEGSWEVPIEHGSNSYEGKIIEYCFCKYNGNTNIKNKKYELNFTAYHILKNHLEYQGLITISIIEYMNNEVIEKAYKYKSNNRKSIFMGFELYNIENLKFQYQSILPDKFYENDIYLIPDNLEDDR